MTRLALPEQEQFTKGMYHAGGSDPGTVPGKPHALLTLFGHELRNPLAAIRGALEVLHLRGSDPAIREWVECVLDRQTKQMSGLVEDLLEISRVERGTIPLHKQPVDLAQVVSRAVEAVRPAVEARGQGLTIDLGREPITVEADPIRLVQILTNLLDNAAKYTEPGGRIGMRAAPEGDEIVLRVRDSGIGIAPEMLSHVFDLFWQAPRAADHAAGGLGIGLALVRQLVELHGGHVTAFSMGLGKGSEFVVRLPRTPCTESHTDTLFAGERSVFRHG